MGVSRCLTWATATRVAIPFDQPILDLARSWSALSDAWALLSDAANIPMIFAGVGLVLWLFWKGARREAILVIVTLALVTAGSEAVKQLVHRPRPPGSDTVVPGVIYSFPSGHVLEAVTILGIVAVLVWRSSLPLAGPPRGGDRRRRLRRAGRRCASRDQCPLSDDVLAGFLAGIGVLAVFILLTPASRGEQPQSSR